MRKFIPTMIVLGVVAVGFVVFARRLKELNDRLASMERRIAAAPARTPSIASENIVPSATPAASLPLSQAAEERRPPRTVESTPATGGGTPSVLTAEQQAAVSREVERILNERMASLPTYFEAGDPLEVLEKELGLTPAQKLRIGKLFDERDAEIRPREESTSLHDLSEVSKIYERYEEAILRELDLFQQEKYKELQEAGKLLGRGSVFYFSARAVEEKK